MNKLNKILLILILLLGFGSFVVAQEDIGATVIRVYQGGTGAQTFTAGECLVGAGTGAITTAACGSPGVGQAWEQVGDNLQPTSTLPVLAPNGLQASSTVLFANSTSTVLHTTQFEINSDYFSDLSGTNLEVDTTRLDVVDNPTFVVVNATTSNADILNVYDELLVYGNATTTGSHSFTEIILSDDYITDFAGTNLSVTGGVLNAAASGDGASNWQQTLDATTITPTTTNAGLFITGSTTISADFRVDGNITTTGTTTIENAVGEIKIKPWTTGSTRHQGTAFINDVGYSYLLLQGDQDPAGDDAGYIYFESGNYTKADGNAGYIGYFQNDMTVFSKDKLILDGASLQFSEGGSVKFILDGNQLYPNTDSAIDLGKSDRYWDETFTDELLLNSTAKLGGLTAGIVALTGDLTISANATTTGTMSATTIEVNDDYIIDFTGTNLSVTNGVLSAASASGDGAPAWEWDAGNLGITPTTTGAGIYLVGSATTTGYFYGNLIGAVTGNASTASALTDFGGDWLVVKNASSTTFSTIDNISYWTDNFASTWLTTENASTTTFSTTDNASYWTANFTTQWNALHNATTTYPGFTTQFAAESSTNLSDTADLLYETELDDFSELQTQIGDKVLVNEEDAVTWDALGTFSAGASMSSATSTGTLYLPELGIAAGTFVAIDAAGQIIATTTPSGAGAPTNATYITQTANGDLSAEQALDGLATGIMRVNTADGVITSLTDSAGIAANISDETGMGLMCFATLPQFTTGIDILGYSSSTSIIVNGNFTVAATGHATTTGSFDATQFLVNNTPLDIAGWDAHIADNTQAHTDYLLNNADDVTSGGITMNSGTTTDTFVIGGTLNVTGALTFANDTILDAHIDWGNLTDLAAGGEVTWGNITAGELANDSIIDADIDDDGVFAFSGIWGFSSDVRVTGVLHATSTDFDVLTVNGTTNLIGNATTTGHHTITDGTNGVIITPGATTTFSGF